MGASKPLLPLGRVTVVERVVGALSRAGVEDIVVVTGHDSERIVPVLDRLPVRAVHNAEHETGMFSSVRTGVRALREVTGAFFVLPVDYPLIGGRVLDRLIDGFRKCERGILHPTCCGLRGHPPLISSRYGDALLHVDEAGDLHSFLQRHADDEAELDVEDLTILMDMDTVEDYGRIVRFAELLDAEPANLALSAGDASYLLALLGVADEVVRHCQTVAAVGVALAEALEPHMAGLDVELVRSGCLLHDLARARPKHAVVAQSVLANLGLDRLGEVVGAHMVMPPELLESPRVTEEELVFLADKLVVDDEVAGLEERAARAERRWGLDPRCLEGVGARMRMAGAVRDRVESLLERPLDEVLPRQTRSSI